MTHDEPFFMAPDDKHDLISGTCSHLPLASEGYGGYMLDIAIQMTAIWGRLQAPEITAEYGVTRAGSHFVNEI
ncbi:hypothetical protein [Aeromonas rivipollensis]|uniref:hypothetical protein n=1 Tax=Aeromonas rivipollensis TaxID=948519 RepID=UPI00399C5322